MASTWCLVPIPLSYIMFLLAFSFWLRIETVAGSEVEICEKSQRGVAISYFNLDVSWAFHLGQLSF